LASLVGLSFALSFVRSFVLSSSLALAGTTPIESPLRVTSGFVGTTSARPPIQVTPTPAVPTTFDDLPGPPVELGPAMPPRVELPEIPDLRQSPPVAAPPPVARPRPALVSARARNFSIDALNVCHAALRGGRHDAAIRSCRASVTAWRGNHRGWYGWAMAHSARREWGKARIAIEHAVVLRPDLAMYQLVYGVALYQLEAQRVRAAADDGAPKLDAARAALVRAIVIDPRLWRARYSLGCVERDRRADRAAAAQFTAAIRLQPSVSSSYVALAELYRATGHAAQALAVAKAGTAHVATADAATLWFEVAMAHDALNAGRAAIAAINRAVALRPDDAMLKLERGRLYFQRADLVAARRDLEDVARSTDPELAAEQRRASQLLDELAQDGAFPGATYRRCGAFGDCYPVTISNESWMGSAWTSPIK
jgi:tetratricopeptide (TPR) repeat protein